MSPNWTSYSIHTEYVKLTQHGQCDVDCFLSVLVVSFQSVNAAVTDLDILSKRQLHIPGVGVIRIKSVGDWLNVVPSLWGIHPPDVGGGVSSDDTPQGYGAPRSYGLCPLIATDRGLTWGGGDRVTPPQRTHVMMYVWRRIQGDPSTKDTRDDVRMEEDTG